MGLPQTRKNRGGPPPKAPLRIQNAQAGFSWAGERGRPGLRARQTPLGTNGGSDPRAEAYLGSGLRLLSAPAIPEQEADRKGVGTRKE